MNEWVNKTAGFNMQNDSPKRLALAIDGNSLSYRAYYATLNYSKKYLNEITSSTYAVRLMLIMCLKLLKMHNYQFSLVAFDTQAPTFRKLALKEYKSKRKGMPASLVKQIPLIAESLRYVGFSVLAVDGWEADDLIGSFVSLMRQNNVSTDIFSSDYDLLQLVSETCSLFMPLKGVSQLREYNAQNFSKLFYDLTPQQVPYLKALAGDASDNYGGVKGIGKKSAITLLRQYKDIDGIFQNSLKLTKKQYRLISEQLSNLKLCLELSLIRQDYFQNTTNILDFALRGADLVSIKNFVKKYSIDGIDKYLHF